MSNPQCDGCGIAASDLPDGFDLEETYFSEVRGYVFCFGCAQQQNQGQLSCPECGQREWFNKRGHDWSTCQTCGSCP